MRGSRDIVTATYGFPEHMLAMLDREAELRGINRQALIKTWLYERLHAAGK